MTVSQEGGEANLNTAGMRQAYILDFFRIYLHVLVGSMIKNAENFRSDSRRNEDLPPDLENLMILRIEGGIFSATCLES